MTGLAEKPGPAQARAFERRYGRGSLFLLEGRARLTAAFVNFARARISQACIEPKLALVIAAFAASHPVQIVEASADVTDLGSLAASDPDNPAFPQGTRLAWTAGITSATPSARRSSG